MQTGGNSYYYTMDLIGSVLQLADSAGNQAAAYTYNPYGKTLTATGSQAATNHYRYASGYTDTTGLIKFGARYYSPTLGRFTQPDPSGQETNNYAYTGGNPTNHSDPTGLDFGDFVGDVSNFAGAGAGLGTTIGAGVGLLGGPFAEVTVPAGAGAGAIIGTAVGTVGGLIYGAFNDF